MERAYFDQVERAKKECWPVLIPIGTMEYHSTHLPYGTDTLVALGVCERVAKETDCMIMPPVWYGVSSYAVKGPESNTLTVDCDNIEEHVYQILKSLFLSGFKKNIYIVIAHQTEDYMPMTLACMKAAKKLIMQTFENEQGYGWWGNKENAGFYDSLTGVDSPWNKIRVIRLPAREAVKKHGADHAGKYESSMLEALYPGSLLPNRINLNDDWFAQDATEFDVSMGEDMVKLSVKEILDLIKGK